MPESSSSSRPLDFKRHFIPSVEGRATAALSKMKQSYSHSEEKLYIIATDIMAIKVSFPVNLF